MMIQRRTAKMATVDEIFQELANEVIVVEKKEPYKDVYEVKMETYEAPTILKDIK